MVLGTLKFRGATKSLEARLRRRTGALSADGRLDTLELARIFSSRSRISGLNWGLMVVGTFLIGSGRAVSLPEIQLLPETMVTAERYLGGDVSTASWSARDIALELPQTIDQVLSGNPEFSLYRRQSALFGNPTSAGVSLRGVGASAAARTLVLRDGIPQNDPFGGWVSWARYAPGSLSSVRIIPAAQGAVWGNQSPAGVIHLTGRVPLGHLTRMRSLGGSHGTRGLTLMNTRESDDADLAVQTSVHTLMSDGFYGLEKEQRGVIDRRLGLTTRSADFRLLWRPDDDLTIEPSLSFHEERRGNGTAISRNATEALDFSVRVTKSTPSLTLQSLAYYQQRSFESVFAKVATDRSSEVPALDQFDVPGEGIGGGFTAALSPGEDIEVVLGADLRRLRGETNEQAGFVDGAFLRRRKAGGEQLLGGLFIRGLHEGISRLSLEGSARIDYWSFTDGLRIEERPATGALLRDSVYRDREDFEPSLSGALRYRLSDLLELRASLATSFRLPTINELYRPFRVRNDITEANPTLLRERFDTVDLGVAWRPVPGVSCDLSLFQHWIDDAIANVPITNPTEATLVAGFVPPGGSVAQRQNVDHARVWGLSASMRWKFSSRWSGALKYLFSRSRFTSVAEQNGLEGKPFPQSPEHGVTATIRGRLLDKLRIFAEMETSSSQFDDPTGERRLGSWWTTRLGGEFEATDNVTIHARVENLFDQEVTTGLGSTGMRSIGQPRSLWLGMDYSF